MLLHLGLFTTFRPSTRQVYLRYLRVRTVKHAFANNLLRWSDYYALVLTLVACEKYPWVFLAILFAATNSTFILMLYICCGSILSLV